MKIIITIFFVSILFFSCSEEQLNNSGNNTADFAQSLKDTDQEWFKYIINEDSTGFEKILAQDVSLEFPRMTLTRKQFIDVMNSGTYQYDSVERVSTNFRIFGTAGVVNGIYKIYYKKKDNNGELLPMQDRIAFTAVYAQTDSSKIQLVAWQGTMREE